MTPPLAPAARLLDLIIGSWLSAAIGAAAELGVADAMSSTSRPTDDIAQAIGADPDSLHRLLAAGTDMGLFQEGPPRHFALTDLGRTLRSDAADSMRGFARWIGSHTERAVTAHIADAVRTGGAVFETVLGKPAWEYLRAHPDIHAVFDQGMTDISAQITADIAGAYHFGTHHTLVDIGGGRGRLLATLLTAHPALRGILYDQPDVVADAAPLLQKAGVADRCRITSGDFLTAVPAAGDAYLLSNVIHNWNDAQAAHILNLCRNAMAPDGRVLLAEAVVPGSGRHALMTRLLDLSMLANCNGRQRDERQFAALFQKAGLVLVRIHQGPGICSIVEARRA